MSFFTMGGRPAATSPPEVPATRREESVHPDFWDRLVSVYPASPEVTAFFNRRIISRHDVELMYGMAPKKPSNRQRQFFPEDEEVERHTEYYPESERGTMAERVESAMREVRSYEDQLGLFQPIGHDHRMLISSRGVS